MNQHLSPLFQRLQETAYGVHVRECLGGWGSSHRPLSLSFSRSLSVYHEFVQGCIRGLCLSHDARKVEKHALTWIFLSLVCPRNDHGFHEVILFYDLDRCLGLECFPVPNIVRASEREREKERERAHILAHSMCVCVFNVCIDVCMYAGMNTYVTHAHKQTHTFHRQRERDATECTCSLYVCVCTTHPGTHKSALMDAPTGLSTGLLGSGPNQPPTPNSLL